MNFIQIQTNTLCKGTVFFTYMQDFNKKNKK